MTSAWMGERVRLRGIEPDDWAAFHAFDEHTDDQAAGYLLLPPRSVERAKKWARELSEQDNGPDELRLVVADRETGEPVGMVNTHAVDQLNGTFSYGLSIGRPHHRKGYASEAVVLLLRYMFAERRFQKCDVTVYASNQPSLALHLRLGFVEEGRRRRASFRQGRYEDLVLFGITVEEFEGRHGLSPLGS